MVVRVHGQRLSKEQANIVSVCSQGLYSHVAGLKAGTACYRVSFECHVQRELWTAAFFFLPLH